MGEKTGSKRYRGRECGRLWTCKRFELHFGLDNAWALGLGSVSDG